MLDLNRNKTNWFFFWEINFKSENKEKIQTWQDLGGNFFLTKKILSLVFETTTQSFWMYLSKCLKGNEYYSWYLTSNITLPKCVFEMIEFSELSIISFMFQCIVTIKYAFRTYFEGFIGINIKTCGEKIEESF